MYKSIPTDQPAAGRIKELVFYREAMKIYGQLPYFLNRRVQGDFRSNNNGIVFLTFEANYTVVPYGLPASAIDALIAWLEADAGFRYGIAGPNDWATNRLRTNNANKTPPNVFHLGAILEVVPGYAPISKIAHPAFRSWIVGAIHDLEKTVRGLDV